MYILYLFAEITLLCNTYEVYVGFYDIIIKAARHGGGIFRTITRHLQVTSSISAVFLQNLKRALYQ